MGVGLSISKSSIHIGGYNIVCIFVSLASAPAEAESYSTTQKLSCPTTWEPWQRLFAKKFAYCVPVATTISWFTVRAVPDYVRSGISLSAEFEEKWLPSGSPLLKLFYPR